MPKQSILGLVSTTQFEEILNKIDSRLYILGSGNPNGVVATDEPGRQFFDSDAGIFYKCLTTDGTISGTTWDPLTPNLDQATEITAGAAELASAAEVLAGTDALRIVTPLQLANYYMSKAGNLSGIGSPAAARTNLNLGSLSTQNHNAVAFTGGTVDGITIGGTTRAAGSFSDLTAYSSPKIRGDSGVQKLTLVQTTAGVNRWAWGGTNEGEGGGNTGTNFALFRFGDTGTLLGTPLSINRSTGAWTMMGSGSVSGNWAVTGSWTATSLATAQQGLMGPQTLTKTPASTSNWYRIGSFPAANSGQDVELNIMVTRPNGNCHHYFKVKLAKTTRSAKLSSITCRFELLGIYTDLHGVANIRVVPGGANAATFLDVAFKDTSTYIVNVVQRDMSAGGAATKFVVDTSFTDQGTAANGTSWDAMAYMSITYDSDYGLRDGNTYIGWAQMSAGFTAIPFGQYSCQTTAPFTVTLPANPQVGWWVQFRDHASTFDTNKLTINRNGQKIMGLAENMDVTTPNAAFRLVFAGATTGWRIS